MDKKIYRVAVPSQNPGGLNAARSGHFGRCDCFTLVNIVDGEMKEVEVIENPPHVEGGCLGPVNLLARHGVDAIVVGGIGMRPLEGFRSAGIEVYVGTGDNVNMVAKAFSIGALAPITQEYVCGGH